MGEDKEELRIEPPRNNERLLYMGCTGSVTATPFAQSKRGRLLVYGLRKGGLDEVELRGDRARKRLLSAASSLRL